MLRALNTDKFSSFREKKKISSSLQLQFISIKVHLDNFFCFNFTLCSRLHLILNWFSLLFFVHDMHEFFFYLDKVTVTHLVVSQLKMSNMWEMSIMTDINLYTSALMRVMWVKRVSELIEFEKELLTF